MCLGGGKKSSVPARAPEAPSTPDVKSSRSNTDRQRRAAANGTVFTSVRGTDAANVQTKSLLGQ